jgi:hypothetical protein
MGTEKETPVAVDTGSTVDTGFTSSKGEAEYATAMLADDPEYQKSVKEEAATKAKDEPAPKGDPEPKHDESTEPETSETPDEKKPDGDKLDDDEPEESPKDEPEYQDNVIPELTGKQFGSLPEDVREIVAKTATQIEELKTKGSEVQSRLEKLLTDPIIKHREEIMNSGKGDLTYELPTITDQLFADILKCVDEDTPEARKKARDILGEVVKQASELSESNARILENSKFNTQKMLTSAGKNLLKLGELNPELKCDITDPEKLIATPFEKLGNIGKVLLKLSEMQKNKTISSVAKYISEKSPEALYAEMAVELGLPVVLNADKKIRAIVKKSNQAFSDRFRKNKDGGQMPAGKEVDSRKIKNGQIVDGIDIVKLANNDDYHEKMLYKNSGDLKWVDKISRLRERGERFLIENPDQSSSSGT